MFAVNTYEEIEKKEKILNEKHIIVLLFVRPNLTGAKEVIDEFNYLHHNSGRYCSIYAIGYSDNTNQSEGTDYTSVKGVTNSDWRYSDIVN